MLPFHELPAASRPIQRPRPSGALAKKAGRKLDYLLPALDDPSRVIFLDVETTGLSWFYDDITIIGWACAGEYHVHIGPDDSSRLMGALRASKTLVTFNGTLFDLRFLKKAFGDLPVPPVHIDLRYLARRVGLVGGQKAIEAELTLPVRGGLEDVDGAEAVVLWHRYIRGDDQALLRLVDYNRRDILGMCGILDVVLDRLEVHPDLLFSRPRFLDPARLSLEESKLNLPTSAGRAHLGPAQDFNTIFAGTAAERATIVGIDLTGSEARPSGWCVLRGSEAKTLTLLSDDELFSRTCSAKPALISIDSPLSIPRGRLRVEDDDPGRLEFGIMRESERELKRRGINVYPCLLPSMQGLTRRGMRLADRFRAAGIPVIESYPGAAQDIMRIPRKRAGMIFLKQGLADFGIQGPFLRRNVNHDELDAITSAIVGSFFLSGRFEALRAPSEDALIIPNMRSRGKSMLVIGISGRICAGKTTAARVLEQRGFAYTRLSLIIDDEIVSRGEPLNRATRQRVGLEINRTKGQRWLCEKALERVSDATAVVVDGLRFPEDHAFFFERFGSAFVHIHIKTSSRIRAKRYRGDGEEGVPFQLVDTRPVEAQIDGLRRLASVSFRNESSIADLGKNVLEYVEALPQGQDRVCLSRSS